MLYSFARVSAALGMRRQDYFGQGSRGWLRLHEKGGKRHDVPAHHRAAAALDAYVEAAAIEEPKAALFQTMDPAGRRLTGRALERRLVLAMIKRRAAAAGLPPSTGRRSTLRPRPAASCSASSRRWPSSSGSANAPCPGSRPREPARTEGPQEVRADESSGAAGPAGDAALRHVGVSAVPGARHQAGDALPSGGELQSHRSVRCMST